MSLRGFAQHARALGMPSEAIELRLTRRFARLDAEAMDARADEAEGAGLDAQVVEAARAAARAARGLPAQARAPRQGGRP